MTITSEFETDSPAFTHLNSYFLAGQLSRDGATLIAHFFGVSLRSRSLHWLTSPLTGRSVNYLSLS